MTDPHPRRELAATASSARSARRRRAAARQRRSPLRRLVGSLAAGAAVFALAGCGLSPATSYVPEPGPGAIQRIDGLPEDAELTVVSKNFTEQLILGKIAVLTARAAGFEVTDFTNVPGSQPTRELMTAGRGDVTYEYTGTAWITYLGHEQGIPDKREQWQAVHDADLANGLTWGDPAPLNNTYAFAVRRSAVPQLGGISALSDLRKLPVDQRTLCVEAEFNSRPDGLNPMLEAYDLPRGSSSGIPDENIGIYDTGAVYTATARGECNFGEVFASDGRIASLDLQVLEDDRQFFPAYNAAPVFNTDTLERYPQLRDAFGAVTPLLTDETLRELNLRVDENGEEPADVAYDWMVSEGLITDAR